MAAEWGCPPWELEQRAPQLWADRWLARRLAFQNAQPETVGNVGQVQQQGNVRRTRVI